MPRLNNWDEFVIKAKNMYDKDPINCRVILKYRHNDGKLKVKVTDNKQVFQYLVENLKEVKNVDKFTTFIMRNMVSQ